MKRRQYIIGIDTRGTFNDTVIIDEEGNIVEGKADPLGGSYYIEWLTKQDGRGNIRTFKKDRRCRDGGDRNQIWNYR